MNPRNLYYKVVPLNELRNMDLVGPQEQEIVHEGRTRGFKQAEEREGTGNPSKHGINPCFPFFKESLLEESLYYIVRIQLHKEEPFHAF